MADDQFEASLGLQMVVVLEGMDECETIAMRVENIVIEDCCLWSLSA